MLIHLYVLQEHTPEYEITKSFYLPAMTQTCVPKPGNLKSNGKPFVYSVHLVICKRLRLGNAKEKICFGTLSRIETKSP